MNQDKGILIIAHAPLASALRQSVLHVFPDAMAKVLAVDVQANHATDHSLALAQAAFRQLGSSQFLVLTDLIGATPYNVAKALVDGINSRLVAGVNLSMLVRAVTYRHEPLARLVERALAGGADSICEVQTRQELPLL